MLYDGEEDCSDAFRICAFEVFGVQRKLYLWSLLPTAMQLIKLNSVLYITMENTPIRS